MSKGSARRVLRLRPLLAQYRAESSTAHAGVPTSFPAVDQFDSTPDDLLTATLGEFAAQALPVSFHPAVFAREVRFLRHALSHLFRGHDSLPNRLARCVTPGEAYHVPDLGPGFWAALVRHANTTLPMWCPATERGLAALDMFPATTHTYAERFVAFLAGCDRVRELAPDLDADQLSDFLERVARTTARQLPPAGGPEAFAWAVGPDEIRGALREVRTRVPLRKRIRETSPEVIEAVRGFQNDCASANHEAAFEAFRAAFPDTRWETALPRLDDAYALTLPVAERARLWCEIAGVLRDTFRVHPLELADLVLALDRPGPEPRRDEFAGFCSDTFAFLAELTDTNTREWMTANRERYQFSLREPLVELCEVVAARYVRPVLNREHGWDLECDTKPGRALTSICKNDFGRGGPYQPVQWVTFYRKSRANRRADAQFFVRVAADGVRYGFHLGRSAREAGGQFRKAIQEHGEPVFRAISAGLLLGECRFWTGDDLATEVPVKSAADLRAWATNKTIAAGVYRDPADPVLRGDDLPGEVLLTFDRLLPLFACAAEADPRPLLVRRAGVWGWPQFCLTEDAKPTGGGPGIGIGIGIGVGAVTLTAILAMAAGSAGNFRLLPTGAKNNPHLSDGIRAYYTNGQAIPQGSLLRTHLERGLPDMKGEVARLEGLASRTIDEAAELTRRKQAVEIIETVLGIR